MSNFSNRNINLNALRERAFNYRWATLDKDVIPLTAADPDFPVAAEIRKSINDYSNVGYFSYGPAEGLMEFRKAIANWHMDKKNTPCSAQHILPLNSAAQALYLVAMHLVKDGEEAIIPNPVDFLFRKAIENAGGKAVTCQLDTQTGAFDLAHLESLINSKTRAIFICNPNNPLGKTMTKRDLMGIAALAYQYNLQIVSDEIWSDIVYSENAFQCIASLDKTIADRTFIISGLSKNFGLAGLRLGYIITPNKNSYDAIYKLSKHASTAYGVSTLSQIAGTTALNQCGYWLDDFKAHLNEMRLFVLDRLDQNPLFESPNPDSTYLAFPKIIGAEKDANVLVETLHKEARVALIPGVKNFFESQAEGHIRICYATSKEILNEAFDRLDDFAQKQEKNKNSPQTADIAPTPIPYTSPNFKNQKTMVEEKSVHQIEQQRNQQQINQQQLDQIRYNKQLQIQQSMPPVPQNNPQQNQQHHPQSDLQKMRQPMPQNNLQQPLQQPNLQQPVQQPNLQQPVQQPNLQQPVQQPNLQQPVQQPQTNAVHTVNNNINHGVNNVPPKQQQYPQQQPIQQSPNTNIETRQTYNVPPPQNKQVPQQIQQQVQYPEQRQNFAPPPISKNTNQNNPTYRSNSNNGYEPKPISEPDTNPYGTPDEQTSSNKLKWLLGFLPLLGILFIGLVAYQVKNKNAVKTQESSFVEESASIDGATASGVAANNNTESDNQAVYGESPGESQEVQYNDNQSQSQGFTQYEESYEDTQYNNQSNQSIVSDNKKERDYTDFYNETSSNSTAIAQHGYNTGTNNNYAILNAFSQRENAIRYAEKLNRQSYTSHIIQNGNGYRVGILLSSNNATAESELNRIKQTIKNDAWMYKN